MSDGETVKEGSFSAQFARKRTLVTATRTQDCATCTREHRHNYDRPLSELRPNNRSVICQSKEAYTHNGIPSYHRKIGTYAQSHKAICVLQIGQLDQLVQGAHECLGLLYLP